MAAMALMIDTLKFADAFERGGFAPQQARTLATALADAQAVSIEDLATKQDLETLRSEMVNGFTLIRSELTAKLADNNAKADRRMLIIIASVVVLGPAATEIAHAISRLLAQ